MIADKWSRLAERFRRVASNDRSERDVTAAAAHAGRLLREAIAAGFLAHVGNFQLPDYKPQQSPSKDDTLDMAALWRGLADVMFVGNAGHVKWEYRGGPEQVSVGRTRASDWSIRAENYASLCDDLAVEVATADASVPAEQTDKTDARTDSRKKKWPQSARVLKAIHFINDRRKRIAKAGGVQPPRNSLIAEHLGKSTDSKAVKNLDSQVQKYRHCLLPTP